jgi:hypothetical protein
MEDESLTAELARLRTRQHDIRQNEVYGGLSKAERAEYEVGAKRIDELTRWIEAIALSGRAQAAEPRVE